VKLLIFSVFSSHLLVSFSGHCISARFFAFFQDVVLPLLLALMNYKFSLCYAFTNRILLEYLFFSFYWILFSFDDQVTHFTFFLFLWCCSSFFPGYHELFDVFCSFDRV